jgi:hypothetical protein
MRLVPATIVRGISPQIYVIEVTAVEHARRADIDIPGGGEQPYCDIQLTVANSLRLASDHLIGVRRSKVTEIRQPPGSSLYLTAAAQSIMVQTKICTQLRL